MFKLSGKRDEAMTKKDATIKARQGITAGDLREILNRDEIFAGTYPSKVNPCLTKRQAWDILYSAIANIGSDEIVDASIATNILREFA